MNKILHHKTPKLRFPGFNDEWDVKKLGDLLEIKSASRVHKNEWTKSGVPFFRSSDVVAIFKRKVNVKAYISQALFEKLTLKSGSIKKGDILITGGGSIGIPYLVKSNRPLYFKDADLLWAKQSDHFNPFFLFIFFTSPKFRRYLNSISHIGTIKHYTIEQAKATPIAFPTLLEQQKIAGFLKGVDDKIAGLQRKKELLEKYKKGIMQKIFSQELRFPGFTEPWQEKKLGSVLVKNKLRNKYQAISYVQSVSNRQGFVSQADYFEGANIASKNTSNYFVIRKGTFAYNPSRIDVGSLAYKSEEEDSIVSPLYVTFTAKAEVKDKFLFDWFSSAKFMRQMHHSFEGSVRNTLSYEALAKMTIMIPGKEEQQKIAEFLTGIDEKIKREERKLEQVKQFKKALLQQMFV
ncbi:TPA: restriction endonuclease subunit S [Candidatus Saccharibacteria bacterium]|nr:restriction endonuclease subunit S [Candidatus Saccharibacteria bacterium]HIO87314.1 restriction endonuclease subunit S [Candidatus Saccharibacteria bacterium]